MSVPRVGPQDAARMLAEEGYVYLDVRSVPEFEQGHPEGAYNIPFLHMQEGGMQPNEAFVAQVRAAFTPETKLLLGCAAGARSLSAAEQLLEAGFRDVVDQRAGFGGVKDPFGRVTDPGWQALGLPVAFDAEAGRAYADLQR